LSAARAGVIAYQTKPVDPYMLVDDLDNATSTEHVDEPEYQILLVEDSQTQAAYFTSMLVRAGMRVKVVHDPMQVLDILSDYAADLILMDMYMPGCNGEELARVIRQVPEYASIPIVFLSAETEVERQLHAMSLGGDDFLTKPISPSHLIRSVTIRAERARTLRSFMVRDNLTGLLNHTRIKEQLKQEIARASRRHDGPVAFAMIDIDNFKQINDVYGHPVGDRVIKTLARVLQQRLRQTDFIGRYGGEEFGVIMPDATAHEARNVLDAVRQSFSRIAHAAGNESFHVTFSGGVAGFPDYEDAGELATRADEALYEAKVAGRNRVHYLRGGEDESGTGEG
jgi:diguanylate cyclase (GGDEF)-like protein